LVFISAPKAMAEISQNLIRPRKIAGTQASSLQNRFILETFRFCQ